MIYAIYKDDGAIGCVAQVMSTTAPRNRLLIFENEQAFIEFRTVLEEKPPRSRENPRIEEVYSNDENLGYRPVLTVNSTKI